jgi:hypothetical protein
LLRPPQSSWQLCRGLGSTAPSCGAPPTARPGRCWCAPGDSPGLGCAGRWILKISGRSGRTVPYGRSVPRGRAFRALPSSEGFEGLGQTSFPARAGNNGSAIPSRSPLQRAAAAMPKDSAADRVWEHIEKLSAVDSNGSYKLQCRLCDVTFVGGLTRARLHLAGLGGNVSACAAVEAKAPSLRPLLVKEIADKRDGKSQQLKRQSEEATLRAEAAKRRADAAAAGDSSAWTRKVGQVLECRASRPPGIVQAAAGEVWRSAAACQCRRPSSLADAHRQCHVQSQLCRRRRRAVRLPLR